MKCKPCTITKEMIKSAVKQFLKAGGKIKRIKAEKIPVGENVVHYRPAVHVSGSN